MKKKQTAVEYIMKKFNIPFTDYYDDVFQKALYMEKLQIRMAHFDGQFEAGQNQSEEKAIEISIDYYKNLYGKETDRS